MVLLNRILLGTVGLADVAILLGMGHMALRLVRLHRQGQNGITLAMALERAALGLVWMWNIGAMVALIILHPQGPLMAVALAIRLGLGVSLLAAMVWMDRRLRRGD